MIDRYLIRYFLAVLDQGNFSRAAAHCNVSQPTISAGIAKLEEALGSSVFFRSNQRVELTEAGNRFVVHARRIEREFNLALHAMSGATPRATLRLGVLSTIPGQIIANALKSAKEDPVNLVELVYGSERELAGRLSRGRLDVALSLIRSSDTRFLEQPLVEEGYVLVMPANHRFAAAGLVQAEDLSNETMIVRRHCEALSETSRYFVERGVRPHFAMRSTNDERVMQMIAAGLGVTVMPESYQAPGLSFANLAGFSVRRTIGLQFSAASEHLNFDPPPMVCSIVETLAAPSVKIAART